MAEITMNKGRSSAVFADVALMNAPNRMFRAMNAQKMPFRLFPH